MTTIEGQIGEHIADTARRAITEAKRDGEPRVLVFNDARLAVEPHSTVEEVCAAYAAYDAAREESHRAYMLPERVAERERAAQIREGKRRRDFTALVESMKTSDEKALRASPDPWPYTTAELNSYIAALNERQHDYGTCVYAMSLSAMAAFNFIAHTHGTTGFQSSCADMDILRRTRHLKSGFQILDFDKILYPQFCNEEHFPSVERLLRENRVEIAKQAQEKIVEAGNDVHPEVWAHWQRLVLAGKE